MSILKNLIKSFFKTLPLKDIILFEAVPDFSEDVSILFKYLTEQDDINERFKYVWCIEKEENRKNEFYNVPIKCVNIVSSSLINRLRMMYYKCCARIIIESNRVIYKERDNQMRIHIPHGLPIKKCENYNKSVGECDLQPVSAPFFVDCMKEYMGDSLKILGLPRDQILYDHPKCNTDFIIWMPTFRQHKRNDESHNMKNSFPLGIPAIHTFEELISLNALLKEHNIFLLLRIHPAQDTSIINIQECSNILFADDDFLKRHNVSLYNLIGYSAALITDYSSVYWDYYYLDRPIGLSIEDIEEYDRYEGLIYKPYFNHLPGWIINDISDLKEFVESIASKEDPYRKERNEFMEHLDIKRFDSCKLIYEELKEYLKKNPK